jgi:hypothetical protein
MTDLATSKGDSCHNNMTPSIIEKKYPMPCLSPDSVMAWPGEGNNTTPMKRLLNLSSPDSPPATGIADDDDTGRTVVKNLDSPTLAAVVASDMTSTDFVVGAQSDPSPQTSSSSSSSPVEEYPTLTRRVSFADEWGSALGEIRIIAPPALRRAVVLLLSPPDRKFEFLNIEYPLDDTTTVQVVLDQIPKLASNPVFRHLTFSSVARTCKNEKLDNKVLMGECELADNELLLGILTGYPVTQIGAFAVPLLLNGDIIKAVGRAKRSGKGLKTVKSGNEWRRRGKQRKIPRSKANKAATFIFECPLEATEAVSLDNKFAHADTSQPNTYVCDAEDCVSTIKDVGVSNDGDTGCTVSVTPGHGDPTLACLEASNSALETNARSVVQHLVAADWEGANSTTVGSGIMTREGYATETCPDSDQLSEDDDASTGSSDLDSSESNARSVVDQLLEGSHDECGVDEYAEIPEVGQQETSLAYPDLFHNHLDDEDRIENTMYWIHAMSIAAVCYITTVTLR